MQVWDSSGESRIRTIGAADDRRPGSCPWHGLCHGMGDPVAADPWLFPLGSRAGGRFPPGDEPAAPGRPAALDRNRACARRGVVVVLLRRCGARPLVVPQGCKFHRSYGLRAGVHQSGRRTQHYHADPVGVAADIGGVHRRTDHGGAACIPFPQISQPTTCAGGQSAGGSRYRGTNGGPTPKWTCR